MLPTLFAKGNQRTVGKLERFRKDAHAERAPKVALRIQGIILSLERHNVTQIAKLLHVHRDTARCWVLAWNAHREIGLLEGHRSGRPAKLTDKEKEILYDIVESGPVAYGFETGVWTSPIISRVIEEEFGVVYHPGHVRKLLKDLGFSIQRPSAKLARADSKQQNRWIRYTRPNLKKKPEKRER